jgi:hypothetical protein
MQIYRFGLIVVLPVLATIGSISRDAQAATCSDIDCTGTIKQLTVFRNGHTLGATVELDSNTHPTASPTPFGGSSYCTLHSGAWYVSAGSDDLIKSLVAAHLSGRKVTLRQVKNTGICNVAYVTVW